MTAEYDLTIAQGETFDQLFLWASEPYIYRPITGIERVAPVRIKCPLHGAPDGWPVAVVSVLGMTQINASQRPPLPSEYKAATVVDADTLEINEVNAAEYYEYKSGGYVQFWTPVDLSVYSGARMTIRDRKGGTALVTFTSAAGELELNNVAHGIRLKLSAAATAALAFAKGEYDLEVYTGGAVEVVTRFLQGSVTVSAEITTVTGA